MTEGNKLTPLPPEVLDDIVKLVTSVNEMIQNFKAIREPIIESSNSVPQATQQLDKVTEETERVTHKMLDLVEGLMERGMDTAMIVDELLASNEERPQEDRDRLEEIKENSDADQNDLFLIMDALQFQDITSQQINHANAILDTIENKLQSLLSTLGEVFDVQEHMERCYDPNATVRDGETRQKIVDNVIEKTNTGKET